MAILLPTTTITTAVTAALTPVLQIQDVGIVSMLLQANLIYGSGGTTVSFWAQTSLDNQKTWVDIANFSFTTSSAIFVYNLSSLTAVTTEYAPTDGTLSANTSKDGILGSFFRGKYTTTGTYAGGTTLRVDAMPRVALGAVYNANI